MTSSCATSPPGSPRCSASAATPPTGPGRRRPACQAARHPVHAQPAVARGPRARPPRPSTRALILGINLESDSPRIAAAESAALAERRSGGRHLAGLELGNEPEVYGTLGWYHTPAGVGVPGRPASYDFGSYLRRLRRVSSCAARARAARRARPRERRSWLAGLGRYLAANPRVRLVTFHRYPLHRCFTARHVARRSRRSPTSWPRRPPTGPATSLAAAVRAAHARGIPLRADELNSVSCGGARGVSDTFASALWVLDTLFNMARVGRRRRQHPHLPQGDLRAVRRLRARRALERRRCARSTTGCSCSRVPRRPRSRLLPAAYRGPSTLRIWSTRGPGGRVRVVLINESRRLSVTVAVRPPGPGLDRPSARACAPRAPTPPRASRSAGSRSPRPRAPACWPGRRGGLHCTPSGAARGPPVAGLGDAADRHGPGRARAGPEAQVLTSSRTRLRLTAPAPQRYVAFANDCSTPVRPSLNGTAHESGG